MTGVQTCALPIFFLWHPVYAVSTVLFAILISSGIGSYLSGRFSIEKKSSLRWAIPLLCGITILYIFILPYVFNSLVSTGVITRQVTAVLLLVPLGILMGIPFPTGIRILGVISKELIPWAWCINGCSSVLSSVLAVIIALSFGFTTVLICAALVYLVGLVLITIYVKPLGLAQKSESEEC